MNTNKKLDNKGFSLVELIIVIAIMAILVGVVGTQVIPYIEKSRQSKDLQILSGYCTNMTSAVSNCAAVADSTATYTITIAATGTTISSSPAGASGSTEILDNFCELAGSTSSNLKWSTIGWESKVAKNSTAKTVTCVYNPSSGVVVTLNGQTKISSVSTK